MESVESRATSQGVREAAVKMKNSGMKVNAISKILEVPHQTISSFLKRYEVRGFISNAQRTERPSSTSFLQDRRIIRRSKVNPHFTAVSIAAEFSKSDGLQISRQIVGGRLNDAGIYGRRPARKAFITAKDRKARVAFAQRQLTRSSAEWIIVLFTDESKFNLFESDGIQYVRRPSGERFDPKYTRLTVKHSGGSVMVYGAFSLNGMGPISRSTGR